MSKQKYFWAIPFIAIGALLAQPSYSQDVKQEDTLPPAEQETVQAEPPAPLSVIILEEEETANIRQNRERMSDKNQSDDLIAQQRMAEATEAMNRATHSMMWASWISNLFVLISTGLLGWTLYLTRKANDTAHKAVTVTKEMGIAQTRAYIGIETGKFSITTYLKINIGYHNTGNSPALNNYLQNVLISFYESGVNARGQMHYSPQQGQLFAYTGIVGSRAKEEALIELTFPADIWHFLRSRRPENQLQLHVAMEIQWSDIFGNSSIQTVYAQGGLDAGQNGDMKITNVFNKVLPSHRERVEEFRETPTPIAGSS